MKNSLIILDVRRQKPGDRFLIKTDNIVAEVEVAQPDKGVVLIASSTRKRRYHRPIPILRVGRNSFLGEPVVTIERMKTRER